MLGNRECGVILNAQKGNTAEKIVLVFLGIYVYGKKFVWNVRSGNLVWMLLKHGLIDISSR